MQKFQTVIIFISSCYLIISSDMIVDDDVISYE